MFWILYCICSIFVCFFSFPKHLKHRRLITTLLFITLVTPAQIELGSPDLAPSIFIFSYDVVFEREISLRSLRPLALTLPSSFVVWIIYIFFKRKFFR